jgi:hypothetical protein
MRGRNNGNEDDDGPTEDEEMAGSGRPPPPPPDSLGELLSLARDIHRQQREQPRVVVHRMDADSDEELVPASGGGGPPPPPPGFVVAEPLVSELLQTHHRTVAQMQAQHAEIQQLRNAAMQYEHQRAAEAMARRVQDQQRHEETMAMFRQALGTREEPRHREGAAHSFVNRLAGSIASVAPIPIAAPTPRELAMADPAIQEKRESEEVSEQPSKKKVLERPVEVAAADSRRRTSELAAAAASRRSRAVDPDATIFASYEPAKRLAPEKAMPYTKSTNQDAKALAAVARVVGAVSDAPRRQRAESSAMSSQDRPRRRSPSVASVASTVPYEDVVEMQATVAADTSGRPTIAPRVAKVKVSRNMGQRFAAAGARRLALQKFAERREAIVGDTLLPVTRKTAGKTIVRSRVTKAARTSGRAR